jgi:protein phosphatase
MKIQLFEPQAIYELGARLNQEDNIYPVKGQATAQNHVFLVCDGMGGCDKGEVASQIVCNTISETVEASLNADEVLTDASFNNALQKAYDALDAADVNNEAEMGTTLTFLCFHRGGCLAAHIGDSRIYHLRPSLGPDMGMLYRSRDHSLVQQLYEMGQLTYKQMSTDPRKNVILKALQPHQPELTMATLTHITDVKAGDYFFMCSDGMLEQMDDALLLSIIGAACSDEEKVSRLVEATKDNQDNHSAYLIKVKSVEREEEDKNFPEDEFQARVENKVLNDPARKVILPPPPFPKRDPEMMRQAIGKAGQVPSRQQKAVPPVTNKKGMSQGTIIGIVSVVAVFALAVFSAAGYYVYNNFFAEEKTKVETPVVEEKIPMAVAYQQLGSAEITFDVVRQIENDVEQSANRKESEDYSNRLIALKQIFLEEFMAKEHSLERLTNIYTLRAAYFSPEQREVMKWFFELPKHQQEMWETTTERVISFQDFKEKMTNLIYY